MRWRPLALATVLLPSVGLGQWYEWRDAGGTLHVTDQLASPPPAPVVCRGAQCRAPRAPAAAPDPAPLPDRPADPRAEEMRRREAQLASRVAHLGLLRSTAGDDPARRQLENLLTDEVRADRAAIAALRAALGVTP